MEKKYVFIILFALLFAGFAYQYTKSKQASTSPQTKVTEPVQKSINRDRLHYTTITNVNKDIENIKKGVYISEVWFDRISKKQRVEAYYPDGTLRYLNINVQTAKGLATYEFVFDPKTKKGTFNKLPLDSQSLSLGDEFEKDSSGNEYYERIIKLIKEGGGQPATIEEIQQDGKNLYKITLFDHDKKTIVETTLLDKTTHLPYQKGFNHFGNFSEITTYNYITDDFSDKIFTLQPPKGYTLAN